MFVMAVALVGAIVLERGLTGSMVAWAVLSFVILMYFWTLPIVIGGGFPVGAKGSSVPLGLLRRFPAWSTEQVRKQLELEKSIRLPQWIRYVPISVFFLFIAIILLFGHIVAAKIASLPFIAVGSTLILSALDGIPFRSLRIVVSLPFRLALSTVGGFMVLAGVVWFCCLPGG